MISKKSLLKKLKGLYAIIDSGVCSAANNEPLAVTKACLTAGVTVIQLRAKNASDEQVLVLAGKMKNECRKRKALFILNDRADLALLAGADGLHLGQKDLPVKIARSIFSGIIGVSTHNAKEIRKAKIDRVDYIGFGPVYLTATKKGLPPVAGIELLRTAVKRANIPVVAIGGINGKNIGEIYSSGANCAAVISAVCGAKEPKKAIRQMMMVENQTRRLKLETRKNQNT